MHGRPTASLVIVRDGGRHGRVATAGPGVSTTSALGGMKRRNWRKSQSAPVQDAPARRRPSGRRRSGRRAGRGTGSRGHSAGGATGRSGRGFGDVAGGGHRVGGAAGGGQLAPRDRRSTRLAPRHGREVQRQPGSWSLSSLSGAPPGGPGRPDRRRVDPQLAAIGRAARAGGSVSLNGRRALDGAERRPGCCAGVAHVDAVAVHAERRLRGSAGGYVGSTRSRSRSSWPFEPDRHLLVVPADLHARVGAGRNPVRSAASRRRSSAAGCSAPPGRSRRRTRPPRAAAW